MMSILNTLKIKVSLKLFIGLIISLSSYFAIDYISGGIFGADSTITNLQMTAFIKSADFPKNERKAYRAEISLRDKHNIFLKISVFDHVLDKRKRKQLINLIDSMMLRFNFKPQTISIPSTKRNLDSMVEAGCRSKNEYCINLNKKNFQESRGHLYIQTGLSLSFESLSSAAVKIGMLSGKPETDVEVFVNLPKGWNPKTALPEPDHVSSFAWTRLIWEGDNRYGQSVPLLIGGSRAIAENLGIELKIENSRLKTIETTMLFFLSAVFGAGFTLITEWMFSLVKDHR